MFQNNEFNSSQTKEKCFYYRTYSYQADMGNSFPLNFVPQLKPKKHASCTLSPLKLKDSYSLSSPKNRSDNDEQIKAFNIKRKVSKVICLSNISTSTDLPTIELNYCSSMFQRRRMSDLPFKSSLKRLPVKKKSLTILGGLKRIKSAGTVNL